MNIEFLDTVEVNDKAIAELEDSLGICLPLQYKEQAHLLNGSYVVPGAYYVGQRVESINNFYDINNIYEFTDLELPEGIVPFARDAGDNQICFDYRNGKQNGILFVDHELQPEESMELIAKTFNEFLDALFEFDE